MQSHLTLHKTYYNQGFWNVPVDLDRYVREDEGPITLVLGRGGREVQAFVNRSANQNGTARIMGRSALRSWFQQNYAVMDNVSVRFATPNRIILGTPSKDDSLDTHRLRVKVTEHGVTIPKSLLPDVEEADVRKRNGIIEVAPVDRDSHTALEEANRRSKKETPAQTSSANDSGVVQSYLTLWKSFYDAGHFNVPLYFDEYVRPDEGPITLSLGKSKQEIQAYVSRSETRHGNARVKGGAPLRDWFKKNYQVQDKFLVSYDAPNRITLGGPVITSPIEHADPLYELWSDPIPKEELDISDASVNLDKYIYTGNEQT